MEQTLRMEIRSDPAELKQVRTRAEDFALAAGLSPCEAGRVVLAMDEAITNIIRHAYDGATNCPIEIHLAVRGATLHVTLRDHGRCVPRTCIRSRDLNDVRPGGLGVHIMTECMDSVEYQPAPGGGTTLTMTKRIPSPREERTCGPNHD